MHTIKTTTQAYLPHPSVQPKHLTHYTTAMAFIEAHGLFAAITKDGLLALGLDEPPYGRDEGFGNDYAVETPMVFEVDGDGMVSSREVRNWLGY